MITVSFNGEIYVYKGLSTDEKPLENVEKSSLFVETDTLRAFKFDKMWKEVTSEAMSQVQKEVLNSALDEKVEAVEGEGLSENNFTDAYKEKLDNALTEVKVEDVDSESATSGQVLTADGEGGASWQNASGGTEVSGTSTGDNWETITIDGTTKNIPQGESDVEANPTVPSGTTPVDLTGLKIDNSYYAISSGGASISSSSNLYFINENFNYQLFKYCKNKNFISSNTKYTGNWYADSELSDAAVKIEIDTLLNLIDNLKQTFNVDEMSNMTLGDVSSNFYYLIRPSYFQMEANSVSNKNFICRVYASNLYSSTEGMFGFSFAPGEYGSTLLEFTYTSRSNNTLYIELTNFDYSTTDNIIDVVEDILKKLKNAGATYLEDCDTGEVHYNSLSDIFEIFVHDFEGGSERNSDAILPWYSWSSLSLCCSCVVGVEGTLSNTDFNAPIADCAIPVAIEDIFDLLVIVS